MANKKGQERIGEISIANTGEKIEILEYFDSTNCTIRFNNGYVKHNVSYRDFRNGNINNPTFPRVYNKGYFGDGRNVTSATSGAEKIAYIKWHSMMQRCYDDSYHAKQPTYKNCEVIEEWLDFQNFYAWFIENYYEVPGEKMCLDKDLFGGKENKIYSSETCCFLPMLINELIATKKSSEKGLPIGVQKHNNKYRAKISEYGKTVNIGVFDTPLEAFTAYKKEKEKYMEELIEKYKDYLNIKIIDRLMGEASMTHKEKTMCYKEVNIEDVVSEVRVYGLESAIKGSKYPMATDVNKLTDEPTNTVKSLWSSGKAEGHDQSLTGVIVQFDLTFTVKAWTEAERYHFLDFISSQSTMHRITKFNLDKQYIQYVDSRIIEIMREKVRAYNDLLEYSNTIEDKELKEIYVEDLKNRYLEILYSNPCGFKLTAKMTTNYRQLKTIYSQRRSHRLPEWRVFCEWIETLPMFKEYVLGIEEGE